MLFKYSKPKITGINKKVELCKDNIEITSVVLLLFQYTCSLLATKAICKCSEKNLANLTYYSLAVKCLSWLNFLTMRSFKDIVDTIEISTASVK